MLHANPLGDWLALVECLDAAGYPQRWSTDPRLRELTTVQQLKDWTAPGNPQRADEVLGALVRQAARGGANDTEALVVLLHLLCPGADRIASKLQHLSSDTLSLVLGELAIQIRSFPVGRRTRAHAANLLMDTQAAVWRELKPYRTDLQRRPELLIDPIWDSRDSADEHGKPGVLDSIQPGPEGEGLDLVDMLLWARRTGAVDAADLAVFVELAYARDMPGVSPQRYVADAHGWTVRTVQRYRDRALTGLRACSADYLAAV